MKSHVQQQRTSIYALLPISNVVFLSLFAVKGEKNGIASICREIMNFGENLQANIFIKKKEKDNIKNNFKYS